MIIENGIINLPTTYDFQIASAHAGRIKFSGRVTFDPNVKNPDSLFGYSILFWVSVGDSGVDAQYFKNYASAALAYEKTVAHYAKPVEPARPSPVFALLQQNGLLYSSGGGIPDIFDTRAHAEGIAKAYQPGHFEVVEVDLSIKPPKRCEKAAA